jgi:hypothetical protein
MVGSLVVYSGFVIAVAGLYLFIRPMRRSGITKRSRGLIVAGVGAGMACIGLLSPASESRVSHAETRLDEFTPRWQFREYHWIRIAAPPARVFEAIKRVRADEIFLFRALTWIRRGGRPLPESILNAGDRDPLIEVATRNGFVALADDHPREVVIGTVVVAPPGTRAALTPESFRKDFEPGVAIAAMNFLVVPDGPDASFVSTETRVFANNDTSRRKFAAYWRVIYPGSSFIRRMWLRAIKRRAIRTS